MANNQPLSLTTCMGKIGAAGRKLATLSLVQGLLRSIPGLPAAALAGVVIMFFAWSCERQARRRDTLEAQQVKKLAAEEISRLQHQAAGALRDARQSVAAVRELYSQRQQLARHPSHTGSREPGGLSSPRTGFRCQAPGVRAAGKTGARCPVSGIRTAKCRA